MKQRETLQVDRQNVDFSTRLLSSKQKIFTMVALFGFLGLSQVIDIASQPRGEDIQGEDILSLIERARAEGNFHRDIELQALLNTIVLSASNVGRFEFSGVHLSFSSDESQTRNDLPAIVSLRAFKDLPHSDVYWDYNNDGNVPLRHGLLTIYGIPLSDTSVELTYSMRVSLPEDASSEEFSTEYFGKNSELSSIQLWKKSADYPFFSLYWQRGEQTTLSVSDPLSRGKLSQLFLSLESPNLRHIVPDFSTVDWKSVVYPDLVRSLCSSWGTFLESGKKDGETVREFASGVARQVELYF